MSALIGILINIDSQGVLKEVSDKKTDRIYDTVDLPNPYGGYRRAIIRWNNPIEKKVETNTMYFAKMVVVIRYVLDHVDTQFPYTQRRAQYALGMPTSTLKSLITDLACTVNMHPANLGLTTEDDGRLYFGKKMYVRVYIAENLFQLAEKLKHVNREDHRVFSEHVRRNCTLKDLHSDDTIPSRVMDIDLRKTVPVAVIIVEHRNLATSFDWFKENIKGCLIIMTAGYPSASTREFLHLLDKIMPSHVPFLYYTDLDFQGCHIFTTLKYGCKATVWASEIQICPRMVWAGPSERQILDFHEREFPKEEYTCKEKSTWDHRLKQLKKKMKHTANRVDKTLMAGMEHSNVLRDEPELSSELARMMAGGSKCHIALLSDGIPNGTEWFIIQDIDARCGVVVGARPVAPQTQTFQATPVAAQTQIAQAPPVAAQTQAAQEFSDRTTQVSTSPDRSTPKALQSFIKRLLNRERDGTELREQNNTE
ncbi:hypothetical protein G7Y79_00052g087880 [Physcia stellaris]|nr:hypothetical protein G7Y79_00052g087880 [Physcia stellaris]